MVNPPPPGVTTSVGGASRRSRPAVAAVEATGEVGDVGEARSSTLRVTGRLHITITGGRILGVAGVLASCAAAVSGRSAVLVAAAGAVLAAAARARSRSRARRHRYAQRAAAEDLLATFADELHAGAAPTVAFTTAGQATSDALPGLAMFGEPTAALRSNDVPALRQLAVGWQVSVGSGIRLAPIAARLSACAQAAGARDRELRAALAGPRASGRLVACLPLVAAGLGACVGASPLRVLFGTGTGLACLFAGMLCELAGLAWMNRLADRVEHRYDGSDAVRGDLPATPPDSRPGRRVVAVGATMVVATVMVMVMVVTAGGGGGGGAGRLVAVMLGLCVGGAALVALAWARSDPARTHHARLVADVPLALDLVAACLTAGATPALAHRAVGDAVGGPLGAELASVATALHSGRTPREAYRRLLEASRAPSALARLDNQLRRRNGRDSSARGIPAGGGRTRSGPPAQAVVAMVEAFERSGASGARLATTLARLADRSRDEAHTDAIEAARRAGVVAAAPLGLCFLPAFLLLGVCPVILAAVPALPAG
jgi:tight adherence protein B